MQVNYMNDKTFIEISKVGAGQNDTIELPIIPLGDTWMLDMFLVSDINVGDNKSSFYILKWGEDNILPASVTGDTFALHISKDFTGDGQKRFSVVRYNTSTQEKNMPFVIRAQKRG